MHALVASVLLRGRWGDQLGEAAVLPLRSWPRAQLVVEPLQHAARDLGLLGARKRFHEGA